MKFLNPTARKEYLRCPRRFYFRYIHEPGTPDKESAYKQRRELYGIRELGGHLIHREVAAMVRSMAASDHSWNYKTVAEACVREFRLIVAKSLATEPGVLMEGLQLAETFNGISPKELSDDVDHWTTLIPVAIENAFRVAHQLQIKNESSGYSIETEKEVFWMKGDRTYRYIFDVLIRSQYQTICIDWKSHRIDNDDIYQVRKYLNHLHHRMGVPASQLYGFAVDLSHEQILEIPFQPHNLDRYRPPLVQTARGQSAATSKKDDSYPPNPHADLCLRCPYASLCVDSLASPARESLIAA